MWFTTTIFMEIIRELGTSVGVQGRNIQWFLDSFAASLQAVSFIRIVKVVCCPSICGSVLQPLDFGIMPCFKQLYRKKLCAWFTGESMPN